MSRRTVIAAVDGSAESLAAVAWAAREARLRSLPLHLLHARQERSPLFSPALSGGIGTTSGGTTMTRHGAEHVLAETADRLGGGIPTSTSASIRSSGAPRRCCSPRRSRRRSW